MNAMVQMPDHGELKAEHFEHQEYVFSGHFHKRQINGNVTYTRGTQEGARLSVSAQLLSQSKRVMTFNARIVDERERLIAHGSFVFQIIGDR